MSEDHKNRIKLALGRGRYYDRLLPKEATGKGKRKSKPTSKNPEEWTERQIQTAVASVLDKLGLVWFHVPNEGRRSVVAGSRLKAQGLKAGVPDIIIASPAPSFPYVRGVAIELKRFKGGRVSERQKEWLEKLDKRCGWYTVVCDGYSAALKTLEELGFLSPGEKNGR